MINPKNYSSCKEFLEREMSVELVHFFKGQERRFRIDALYDHRTCMYTTSAYIQEDFRLEASNHNGGGSVTSSSIFTIWVKFNENGWTNRETSEAAIDQALEFLTNALDQS